MFNGADYLIFTLATVSGLIGLWRGLVKEVFSLANWLAALILTYLFYKQVGALLPIGDSVAYPWVRDALAAVLIFICTIICGAMLSSVIQGLVKMSGLTGTDRTLGLVFGLGRGAAVIIALLSILPLATPIAEQSWWVESKLIPVFLGFEDWATGLLESLSIWFNTIFRGSN